MLSAEGIGQHVGAEITRVERPEEHPEGQWRVWFKHDEPREFDRLLVAAGRKPCFDGHDLEAAGVSLDGKGRPILTDTLRTTAAHIWAGGDATGDLLFTHVGGYEAELIAADILGSPRQRDYRVVPRVTFCEPEVASVGVTEEQAREGDRTVVTETAAFRDSARAFIEGHAGGMVKLVADATTGELLGGHIVGENAGELIHEVVAAMAARTPAGVVGGTIHAYPTLAETVRGAFRGLAARLEG
jgi:dihydrolipoamide dehydrogenase